MALLASNGLEHIKLNLSMLNRHGLIAGSSGSGKTVTLKKIVELLSDHGVPTLVGDIKGDLTGFITKGSESQGLQKFCDRIGADLPQFESYPVQLLDVFGKNGLNVNVSIESFGSTLLASVLQLNNTQAGVLKIVFRISKEHNLPLNTIDDLRQALLYCNNNREEISLTYGAVSSSSIATIMRSLIKIEDQGGNHLFAEKQQFDFRGLIKQSKDGKGIINLFHFVELIKSPDLYGAFMIYLLRCFYDNLPERGDRDLPLFVIFLDEAHLIFRNASKPLLDEIESIVRLIRSKGVGVIFCSQAPDDVPDEILGQLGMRIQHSMRAYTIKAQRSLKTIAETMRPNYAIDLYKAVQQLKTGQALISVLDEQGQPTETQQAYILPPRSKMGLADEGDYVKILNECLAENNKFANSEKTTDSTVVIENNEAVGGAVLDLKAEGYGEHRLYYENPSERLRTPLNGIVVNRTHFGSGIIGKIAKACIKLFFMLVVVGMCLNVFPPLLFFIPLLIDKVRNL